MQNPKLQCSIRHVVSNVKWQRHQLERKSSTGKKQSGLT